MLRKALIRIIVGPAARDDGDLMSAFAQFQRQISEMLRG